MTASELRAYAKTFPSQGGVEISADLQKYAAEVPEGSAIVELGCWLGAGTAQLALGTLKNRAPIHTYDVFRANKHHVKKALTRGVELQDGEDTLPRVMRSLKPFGADIRFHKEKLRAVTWDQTPIGLYVDDATKLIDVWTRAMKIFRPHFIPQKTILVLMDFYYGEDIKDPAYDAQKNWMAIRKKKFEIIASRVAGTSTAIFRFLGD